MLTANDLTIEQEEAIAKVFGEYVNDLRTDADAQMIRDDILLIVAELETTFERAAFELRIRLGGAQNLNSYMNCLRAQIRR